MSSRSVAIFVKILLTLRGVELQALLFLQLVRAKVREKLKEPPARDGLDVQVGGYRHPDTTGLGEGGGRREWGVGRGGAELEPAVRVKVGEELEEGVHQVWQVRRLHKGDITRLIREVRCLKPDQADVLEMINWGDPVAGHNWCKQGPVWTMILLF